MSTAAILPMSRDGDDSVDEPTDKEVSSSLGYRSPSIDLAYSGASPVHPCQQTCESAKAPNCDSITRADLEYFGEALLDQVELVIKRTMLEMDSRRDHGGVAKDNFPAEVSTAKKRKMMEIRQSISDSEDDLSSLGSDTSVHKKQKVGATDGGNQESMAMDAREL